MSRYLGVCAAPSSCFSNSQFIAFWGPGIASECIMLEEKCKQGFRDILGGGEKKALWASRLQPFPAISLDSVWRGWGSISQCLLLSFQLCREHLSGFISNPMNTSCYFQKEGDGNHSVSFGLVLPAKKFLLHASATSDTGYFQRMNRFLPYPFLMQEEVELDDF